MKEGLKGKKLTKGAGSTGCSLRAGKILTPSIPISKAIEKYNSIWQIKICRLCYRFRCVSLGWSVLWTMPLKIWLKWKAGSHMCLWKNYLPNVKLRSKADGILYLIEIVCRSCSPGIPKSFTAVQDLIPIRLKTRKRGVLQNRSKKRPVL